MLKGFIMSFMEIINLCLKVDKVTRGVASISTIADLEAHLEKIKDDKVKDLVLKYQRKKIGLSQEEASQLMLQVSV